jgi:hypothetical protein
MAPPWNEGFKGPIDHNANGYEVKNLHSGQRRPYGDSYYEFMVKTDKPKSEVEKYCTKHVRACALKTADYLKDERAGVADFSDHFRSHYEFAEKGEGRYFYKVTSPSTH